ncbi:hypothetical protein Tco_0975344 [Tanacetum coccineum]|uniref:Uncharacterized protein n=1 Tax=Tanacetum coccineum TaxID=301880 RepID=A0ABQ5EEF2_9ASTR
MPNSISLAGGKVQDCSSGKISAIQEPTERFSDFTDSQRCVHNRSQKTLAPMRNQGDSLCYKGNEVRLRLQSPVNSYLIESKRYGNQRDMIQGKDESEIKNCVSYFPVFWNLGRGVRFRGLFVVIEAVVWCYYGGVCGVGLFVLQGIGVGFVDFLSFVVWGVVDFDIDWDLFFGAGCVREGEICVRGVGAWGMGMGIGAF